MGAPARFNPRTCSNPATIHSERTTMPPMRRTATIVGQSAGAEANLRASTAAGTNTVAGPTERSER